MQQKLFRFEVDQSIRVEELKNDTIVGLANQESNFTVKLPVRVKRQLYEHFRCLGQPKRFAPKVFAATIVLVVKKFSNNVSELLIDIEYPGYEMLMIEIIRESFPNLLVYFGMIGKKSPAHYAAYGVHTKKKQEDLVITFKEIIKIFK